MPYQKCRWCRGQGCLACDGEREKDAITPLFVAKTSDDIELLGRFFNREIVEKAYSPEGGGTRGLEQNLAIASVVQSMRAVGEDTPEKSSPNDKIS